MTYTHLTQAERYQIAILKKAEHKQSEAVQCCFCSAATFFLLLTLAQWLVLPVIDTVRDYRPAAAWLAEKPGQLLLTNPDNAGTVNGAYAVQRSGHPVDPRS